MGAVKDNKKHQKNKLETEDTAENAPRLGISSYLGIILLAAALFNVPQLLKKPESDADWMMITIVAAMLICGALLMILPGKLKK